VFLKSNRRLNPILTFIILIVLILLVGAITGFRLPIVLASPAPSSNQTAQFPPTAPTATSATSISTPGSTQTITWTELVTFLEKDHTNWNPYIPGKYTCLDFSTDLVANATAQGIKAWIVAVDFTSGGPGHAFVAFATTDRGVVYVEPQADDTYPTVAVGKNLCDSWGVYQCMGTVASTQSLQCNKLHYCTNYTP
jgi:hypothetical protein